MTETGRMITVEEAAERMGVTPEVVRRHCRQTINFPAINVSAGSRPTYRVDAEELEQWLMHRREERRRRLDSAETARLQLAEKWRQPSPMPTTPGSV